MRAPIKLAALYGLPASLTIGAFSIGHLSISPETSPLNPPNVEAINEAASEQDAEEPSVDDTELAEGNILSEPDFQYYPYPSTVIGNIPGSNKLFSFEIAVSIFETPLSASNLMSALEEREPQLRPVILDQTVDLTEEALLSKEGRSNLAELIKASINNSLIRWGYEPFIHSVEITSFIVT